MSKDMEKLRGVVDASDGFMTGFQVGGMRKNKRKPQLWANNKGEIKALLLIAFPKLAISPSQRARAARWARVIHLYYCLNYTYRQTAEEMGEKPGKVSNILKRIYRIRHGRRADNRRPTGRPIGRPKTAKV